MQILYQASNWTNLSSLIKKFALLQLKILRCYHCLQFVELRTRGYAKGRRVQHALRACLTSVRRRKTLFPKLLSRILALPPLQPIAKIGFNTRTKLRSKTIKNVAVRFDGHYLQPLRCNVLEISKKNNAITSSVITGRHSDRLGSSNVELYDRQREVNWAVWRKRR